MSVDLSPAEKLVALRLRCRIDEDGCWLWRGSTFLSGVPRMADARRSISVRRRVVELKSGAMVPRQYCTPTCGKELCIRFECIGQRTRSEQNRGSKRSADAQARVTAGHRRSPARKLSLDKAAAIRERLNAGEPGARIAAAYGVSFSMVRQIARNDAWRAPSPWAGLA